MVDYNSIQNEMAVILEREENFLWNVLLFLDMA
jgi:hypothetical protein